MRRIYVLAAMAVLLALWRTAAPDAHEIPRHVVVHVFMKADGGRLHVLARAPLAAMRDIEFPQRGDGLLDMSRVDPALQEAIARWIVPSLELFENGKALDPPAVAAARISLPSDRSFVAYDDALAHVTGGTLASDIDLPWPQALLDVRLDYPIASDESRFSMKPGFARLGLDVVTVVRVITPGGTVRAFDLRGDPGLVRLDPRRHEAAWRFVTLGFLHILDGPDHLLFLLCLVIPFRRLRPLILIVSAFTVAHSAALVAAAMGLVPDALWFPPLVETLIAASIVFMAIENVVASPTMSRRCVLAFSFGLVHGFGFSFGLTDTLQFAGSHLLTSLFSFNLGVEAGQVLVLIVLVPALELLFRYGVRERIGTIVFSALIAHVAWHWMAERWSALREFQTPTIDAAMLAMAIRVVIGVLIAAGIVWWVRWYAGAMVTVKRGDVGASRTPPLPHDPP